MAEPFLSVLGLPLRKGENGEGIRPILIGEALVPLPGACLQHVVQSKAVKAPGRTQFGIGVAAAPKTMIALCNALVKSSPDGALVALDIANVFGEVSTAGIFEELLERLPEIAPFVFFIMVHF